MKTTRVSKDDDGIRLDRWFARHYPQLRQGELQKALRSKLIRVEGARAEANQRLEAGQVIKHPEYEASAPRPPRTVSVQDRQWLRDMVLYEDENLVVINKPAGLATQGGSGLGDYHLDAFLPAFAAKGGATPKLVHRLDKDTSGVLLLARNAKIADALMKKFARKETRKTYWALVVGVPTPPQGRIDAPLLKYGREGNERMFVEGDKRLPFGVDSSQAKSAATDYRVIETLARRLSWLELMPITGRTHQLRVHLEHLGHPIVGDGKYGAERSFPEGLNLAPQLHLHAREIALTLDNGKTHTFTAPLPPHMQLSWEMLGLSV
jgi:23S rRNA pseudouridine955/2504/2580 synthase